MKGKNKIGVIGAGSFGTAIANLAAHNNDVLLFSRRSEVLKEINDDHFFLGVNLSTRIEGTNDLKHVADSCTLLFLVVPSVAFLKMMQSLSPFVRPDHIFIHGTKGFNLVGGEEDELLKDKISKKNIRTMSQLIMEESIALRVGCLSGPNLASEINEGLPTATVIASRYDEVIEIGQKVLNSEQFHVFGSHTLFGAELAGALKNAIAIGAGIIGGAKKGKNLESMLITRGLSEMIAIGSALGVEPKAFLGTAGIGDLIATATSIKSRNYSFGYKIGEGYSYEEVYSTVSDLAEGLRTIKIMKQLGRYYKIHIPIINILHKIVFEGYELDKAISFLMKYPYSVDVDFI